MSSRVLLEAAHASTPLDRPVAVPPYTPAGPTLGRPGVQIGLVLLVGAAMRAWGLARFPLEQDELYTIWESRDLFRVALEPGIDARPLYFLLQHALFQLLPATAPALRLFPFLFGLAGIWVTWRIGTRLFGSTAGLVAAALLAFSPWHLHASGMARYWSLLYLAGALAYYLAIRAYDEDRPTLYLGALAALLVGGATHPTFLFPAAGVALALSLVGPDGRLGFRLPSRRAWLWLWTPFLLFLATALLALRFTGESSAVRNWGGRGMLATLRLVPGVVEWLTPTIALAGLLGAYAGVVAYRRPAARRWAVGTLVGGAASLLLLVLLSRWTDVYVDYAMSMLPLIFVSAGALVQLATERMARGATTAAWLATAVLLAGVLPGTASHLADGSRFDYRPALAHIERTDPTRTVVTWPLIVLRHYAPGLRGRTWGSQDEADMERLLAEEGTFWAIASVRRDGPVFDGGLAAERWLARRCSLELVRERTRFDWRRYRVELYRCPGG